METLILDGDTVRECMPMDTCIQAMADIQVAIYKGEVGAINIVPRLGGGLNRSQFPVTVAGIRVYQVILSHRAGSRPLI